MELVKPFSHLNTVLGGFGPYCSMGPVYRHCLLLQIYSFDCFSASCGWIANIARKRYQWTGFLSSVVKALHRTKLSPDYLTEKWMCFKLQEN